MRAEIINIGTELLTGHTLNTHQQWLGRALTRLGFDVVRQISIPDQAETIVASLDEAMDCAELIVITGGLGPTQDDRTREAIAALFGMELVRNPEVEAHVRNWYAQRGRPLYPEVLNQAMVPSGATVLINEYGTAPGWIIQTVRSDGLVERTVHIICLPGPPRELYPMFKNQIEPWLTRTFSSSLPNRVCRLLRTTGIPESAMEKTIKSILADLLGGGLEVGYYSRPGEVDLWLTASGGSASDLVQNAISRIEEAVGDAIYATDEVDLEHVVVKMLIERGLSLATAESCTGGLLAHRITNVPGASATFKGGVVAYSNELKEQLLGVSGELLDRHGAVSEPVARAMAEGARIRFNVDLAIGITGIAGPGGGAQEKPVGTVYIALSDSQQTVVLRCLNAFDRVTFKHVTTQQALDLLRRRMLGLRMVPQLP